ncbi:MAG: hypothetical protein WAO98_09530 [Alphaproteobacteria bacterium]
MKIDHSKYVEQLKAAVGKIGAFYNKLASGKSAVDKGITASGAAESSSSDSSLAKVLLGSFGGVEEYYFPADLIGGTCPRVVGEEEDIVWNAAAEACDTERVHVVWQSVENKIWYLAVRSADLASHANTWCPFAAMLPGMKGAPPPPVCYTYYGDESATMMLITTEGLQIFRGTGLVVRAKAERSARELGDAQIVELIPDRIMQLSVVPWYSLSLFEDRARRVLAATAVFVALLLAGISFVIWLFASMSLIGAKRDMSETVQRTREKTMKLMGTAEKLRTSPMRDQLAKFTQLNDGLLNLNGFLEVYEIKDNKARWRAVVPANVTADRINELGGKNIETVAQGIAIGNAAQIEYEAVTTGKK